jgi:hypothetical protein
MFSPQIEQEQTFSACSAEMSPGRKINTVFLWAVASQDGRGHEYKLMESVGQAFLIRSFMCLFSFI